MYFCYKFLIPILFIFCLNLFFSFVFLFFSLFSSYILFMKSVSIATNYVLKSVALCTIGSEFIYCKTSRISTEKVTCFPGHTSGVNCKFNSSLKVSLSSLKTDWILSSIKNTCNLWNVSLSFKSRSLPNF